jgi:transposase-like protein
MTFVDGLPCILRCRAAGNRPVEIEAVYPQTQVQLCMVHLLRSSLKYVPWKQQREVAADLKSIY